MKKKEEGTFFVHFSLQWFEHAVVSDLYVTSHTLSLDNHLQITANGQFMATLHSTVEL